MLMILEAMATSRSQGKRHFFYPKISAKIEVNGYYTITIIHISYIYIYRCTINHIIYANAIIHSISVIYIYISYLSYI